MLARGRWWRHRRPGRLAAKRRGRGRRRRLRTYVLPGLRWPDDLCLVIALTWGWSLTEHHGALRVICLNRGFRRCAGPIGRLVRGTGIVGAHRRLPFVICGETTPSLLRNVHCMGTAGCLDTVRRGA